MAGGCSMLLPSFLSLPRSPWWSAAGVVCKSQAHQGSYAGPMNRREAEVPVDFEVLRSQINTDGFLAISKQILPKTHRHVSPVESVTQM